MVQRAVLLALLAAGSAGDDSRFSDQGSRIPCVFLHRARPDLRTVYVSGGVDGDACGQAGLSPAGTSSRAPAAESTTMLVTVPSKAPSVCSVATS